jgi:Fe-Mn family superoxide dismutase
MAHALPELPYGLDALEPHISSRAMAIHHGKHHQAYVNNLNAALEKHPELFEKSALDLILNLDEVPEDIRTAVRNHGGGHVNHSFFWTVMGPRGGGTPSGSLAKEIDRSFGSFDEFKSAFSKAAAGVFGSGWAWLCVGGDGNLKIATTSNQDNPANTEGVLPIMVVDVWEHAYYLDYQNRRPDFIESWWNVVDWKQVDAYLTMIRIGDGVLKAADWAHAQVDKFSQILRKLTE